MVIFSLDRICTHEGRKGLFCVRRKRAVQSCCLFSSILDVRSMCESLVLFFRGVNGLYSI